MRLARDHIVAVQKRLNKLGFGPVKEDGIRGRSTNNAITTFKKSVGLRARPLIGPLTWARLFTEASAEVSSSGGAVLFKDVECPNLSAPDAPWMDEGLRKMGLHERRDHRRLWDWLRSDSVSVGDPAKIPWCGDFVETCIALTLPDEVLPTNPYLAANWAKWGQECSPQYGAVMSFWRGSPTSWKGHVAFYVAEDDEAYHVLGGNQQNSINVTRIAKKRLRKGGCRWPASLPFPSGVKRRVARGADPLSTNEA